MPLSHWFRSSWSVFIDDLSIRVHVAKFTYAAVWKYFQMNCSSKTYNSAWIPEECTFKNKNKNKTKRKGGETQALNKEAHICKRQMQRERIGYETKISVILML